MISFCLEDKQVVNEHHIIRKSHDATQEKCPHVVHFNAPRGWPETNSWHQKRYFEGSKKIVDVTVYWYFYGLDCTDEPEFHSCWRSKIKLSQRNKHLS